MQKMREKAKNPRVPTMQKMREKAKKSSRPMQKMRVKASPRVPTNVENARKNNQWEKNLRLPGGVTGTEGCQW
jgi:hypothetical protein